MFEKATFAGGCFWCTEALYQRLRGVTAVLPGYAGGQVENPSYEEVSSGTTGHAEAIQIDFDPKQIPYEKLLEVFWYTHDPTTLNRQGNDVGPQYRSAIFFHSEEQQRVAEASKAALENTHVYPSSIITEISPFTNFYPAEDYHRNYYDRNRSQGYCNVVIGPKIKKLLTQFSGSVKDEYRSQE